MGLLDDFFKTIWGGFLLFFKAYGDNMALVMWCWISYMVVMLYTYFIDMLCGILFLFVVQRSLVW